MESERFDRLIMRLGRQHSRRGLVRGVAAAVATLAVPMAERRQVAATANSIPLGGACYRDRQCYTYAAEIPNPYDNNQIVWCQDNGISYDGEFNCCRYEGGYCWSNEHCCRDLSCVAGSCGG